MTTLTEKMDAPETQLATQNTTIVGYIDTLEAKMQSVLDNLDLIIVNNAVNAKYLAQAILAADKCQDCPPPSLEVPPVGTTPQPVDEDRCKRAQAFLQTMNSIFAGLQSIIDFNVPATASLISAAYDTVISGITAGDTVPLPSFAETVNVAGDTLSFAASRLFSGENISELFAGMLLTMRDAIYFTNTPDSAKAAYDGIVNSSSASSTAKLLLSAAAYNALYSYYFDPDTLPDLSGFDGGACTGALASIVECTSFNATDGLFDGDNWYALIVPEIASYRDWAILGDYFGWTFRVTEMESPKAARLYWFESDGTAHFINFLSPTSDPQTLVVHTDAIGVIGVDNNAGRVPFTVEVCPPE